MKLLYLSGVDRDLDIIREYHPFKGEEIVLSILKNNLRLEKSPKLGANLSHKLNVETEFRYFITDKFLSIYKIENEKVLIYRIFDGRQDWLNQLDL
ncbi:MAG: type II toxin-antitoxin system RelE/ParE family toxin [Streptococcaceae bacterium]|nr:type II toxin-antitoxin system RelE/ParE family toxin [Streptococcaceae bacterium]MCL2681389.1 type II toxin-antitoxin system RelE/ParE family toxin [Streptococcaceae bacterium]